ncbi:MAG TPA: lysophospholipase [Candidatus Saccharimonadaceae bacterium]|nr:lysophospholipase [Candidatus Saccharimonadaceae bacterium]
MNPSDGTVTPIGIEVRIERGTLLPGRAWCAEQPRGLVAITHGLGEHGGRYAALAADLVQARYTVVALDLPGHGEAPGPRGDVRSWSVLRDQVVPAMLAASRGLPGQPMDLPRVLLGHSMGGVLALDFALSHPRELLAVAVSAPALRTTMPPWWKLTLANVARVTSPSAGFPNGIDVPGLSRDHEVLRLRAADPLVHDKISPRLYFEFAEACQRVMRDARRLQVPALLMQGSADRVVDPRGALEFTGAAPHGMARLLTYGGAYHELFNDLSRADVVRDLIAWLEAVRVV